jgi:hypothetical protein
MRADWLVRVNRHIFVLLWICGFSSGMVFWVLVAQKTDERGVLSWVEQWSALL